jgi:hypothetical protein
VFLEPELAKHRIKAAAPLAIVCRGVVKDDGDMIADIHCLDNGGRVWLGRGCAIKAAIVRG